jgi:hypothetical protein
MRNLRRAALIAGGAFLAACADDSIDPATRITEPRVLAITTEPSALSVDGELELETLTVDPAGPRIGIGASGSIDGRPVDAMRARVCAPWRPVADPARDCVGESSMELDVTADGRVVVSAVELAATFPAPAGVPAVQLPIIVEVDVDGQTLIARRDVSVVAPTVELQNPQLAELLFDGVATRSLRSGQSYRLTATIDRASLDVPSDREAGGDLEDVVVHFYSPSGELAEADASLEDVEAPVPVTKPNTYTAGPPGTTWLFAVATDETGGQSATAIAIDVE